MNEDVSSSHHVPGDHVKLRKAFSVSVDQSVMADLERVASGLRLSRNRAVELLLARAIQALGEPSPAARDAPGGSEREGERGGS